MRWLIRLVERGHRKLHQYRWKRRIQSLVANGLKIGNNTVIEGTAYIDQGSPFLIEIGNNCVLANGSRILSHDATPYKYMGRYTRLGKVIIKDNCFIGENVTILPGVTIGPNVLVAAGSLINKDIGPNSCVAGVPARFYSKFDEMLDKHREGVKVRTVFDHHTLYYGDNRAEIERCRAAVADGDAYVKGFKGTYAFLWNPTADYDALIHNRPD